jgi:hypothetical protein
MWIISGGVLVTREVTIRYLEENTWARPTIVPDRREREFQNRIGMVGGAIIFLVGAALSGIAMMRSEQSA